jgi:hypothetical protein
VRSDNQAIFKTDEAPGDKNLTKKKMDNPVNT